MSRKCIICKEELKVPARCFIYAENYKQRVTATTECCGNLIVITPHVTFEVSPYRGDAIVDDWGVPIKRKKV